MTKQNKLLTFKIKLSSLIVETVGDLVADDPSDGAVVHVARPVAREEDALQNSGRKLDGILERAVEGVHDRRLPVADPICLVDLKNRLGALSDHNIVV